MAVGWTWCSRTATSSAAVGLAVIPPLPPLKLTRFTLVLLITVLL
jgi:hypothetical protein